MASQTSAGGSSFHTAQFTVHLGYCEFRLSRVAQSVVKLGAPILLLSTLMAQAAA